MRAPLRSPWGSSVGSFPAKLERLACRVGIEDLHRDAHMQQQMRAGLGVGDKRERAAATVVEAAHTGGAVVPRLGEHGDRPDAHHQTSAGSKGSTSMLSSTTPA